MSAKDIIKEISEHKKLGEKDKKQLTVLAEMLLMGGSLTRKDGDFIRFMHCEGKVPKGFYSLLGTSEALKNQQTS